MKTKKNSPSKRIILLSSILFSVFVILILACAFMIHFVMPDKFIEHSPSILGSITAIVAIAAALFAGISAIIANESLKLTRATQRPFLSVSGDIGVEVKENFRTLRFTIKNTGSLPARDIDTHVDFFEKEENVTEANQSTKYKPAYQEPSSPLVFPNNPYYFQFVLDLNDESDSELWKDIQFGSTISRVSVKYKGLDKEHITIQTNRILKPDWANVFKTIAVPPQKWE